MLNPTRILAVLATIHACVLAPLPGRAADPDPGSSPEAQRMERLWQQHWREFAAFYLEHDGRYVCFDTYDRTLANSRGLSARDYLKQSAKVFTVREDKGRDVEKTHTKPQGEVDVMVKALPDFAAGHYGFIHSGMIAGIEGPDTLVLRDVWLVDAGEVVREKAQSLEELRRQSWRDAEDAFRDRDRRGPSIVDRHFRGRDLLDWLYAEREDAVRRQQRMTERRWRIVGFDTRTLVEGKRWPSGGKDGIQVAIVSVADGVVTAVPASRLGKGLTESQFKQALDQRGMTVERFCEVLTEQKRQNALRYRDAVLEAVEGRAVGDTPAPANTEVREAP